MAVKLQYLTFYLVCLFILFVFSGTFFYLCTIGEHNRIFLDVNVLREIFYGNPQPSTAELFSAVSSKFCAVNHLR